jgi:hypothetical protein
MISQLIIISENLIPACQNKVINGGDMDWITAIKKTEPCEEAIEWLKSYESPEQAWNKCKRGDWMLWLIGKLSGAPDTDSRKKLVFTCCQCARLTLPYVQEDEFIPLEAIETAEKYCRDEATLDEVRAAAAAKVAYAANVAHAIYVTDAAVYVAYTANAAAAYAVAYIAAVGAADAAYTANAAADARQEILRQCADIVRQYYTVDEVLVMLTSQE